MSVVGYGDNDDGGGNNVPSSSSFFILLSQFFTKSTVFYPKKNLIVIFFFQLAWSLSPGGGLGGSGFWPFFPAPCPDCSLFLLY